MPTLKDTLLLVADAYAVEAVAHGGKSLARISTIVLNQGSFFDRLRSGKTCTLDSFEAVLRWFSKPENWPTGTIPMNAAQALAPVVAAISVSAE